MTIAEANAVATVLRFAAGEPTTDPDRVRDAAAFLAERAAKPLLMRVDYDVHGLDAALTGRAVS